MRHALSRGSDGSTLPNDQAHLPGPPCGRETPESKHGAPVCRGAGFGGSMSPRTDLYLDGYRQRDLSMSLAEFPKTKKTRPHAATWGPGSPRQLARELTRLPGLRPRVHVED